VLLLHCCTAVGIFAARSHSRCACLLLLRSFFLPAIALNQLAFVLCDGLLRSQVVRGLVSQRAERIRLVATTGGPKRTAGASRSRLSPGGGSYGDFRSYESGGAAKRVAEVAATSGVRGRH
jgi:hypothetical protein